MSSQKDLSPKIPSLRFQEFQGEWRELEFGKFLIPTLRPVEKPNNPYLALGVRSHFKGLFHKPDSDPKDIEMDTLYAVKEDDFIVNITFGWEGAVAIASKKDEGGLVSHRFPTYIFDKKYCLPNYFRFVFPNDKFKNILSQLSPGGAGRNRVLSKKELPKISFVLPDINEQAKIASFLSSVDEKIEKLKTKKSLLEQYKKGMMQKLFNQEIRFKDKNGKEYGEWVEKNIQSIFDKVTRGNVLSMSFVKENKDTINCYPVYSSQTKNNGISGFYNEFLFENAITWTTDGANAGDVNYRQGKFYCTNVCGVLLSSKGYANQCIAEMLNFITRNYVSYVGNPKLMNNIMSEIKLKIPPIPEQQKIASFLNEIDKKIESIGSQVEQAKQWKKGLLQGMFV